jgi:hypothetical protein
MASDALVAHKVNLNSGGKTNPIMRDSVWEGKVQKMVLEDGRAKGGRLLCQERGLWKEGMTNAECRAALAQCDDFKNEKTILEKVVADLGGEVWMLPKCHPELNPDAE